MATFLITANDGVNPRTHRWVFADDAEEAYQIYMGSINPAHIEYLERSAITGMEGETMPAEIAFYLRLKGEKTKTCGVWRKPEGNA